MLVYENSEVKFCIKRQCFIISFMTLLDVAVLERVL
jgi:hypothetical protein